MTVTGWLTFRLLIREEWVLYMGLKPGYPDRPCVNFRADHDCAVLGFICDSVEHPTIGMSVCGRHVAGEMLNRFARNLLLATLHVFVKTLKLF